VPNIPGVVQYEHAKMDMATFLNDNQDLIHIDDKGPKSARQGKVGFNLDLDKVKQVESADPMKSSNRGLESAFQQSSLSNRSHLFNSSGINQQIVLKQQQQNQNLVNAMQGQQLSGSRSQLSLHQQFEFFVDEYSDEQIQEIISIFRNDFKPPKNLWIEKQAEGNFFNVPDYYADIYSSAIEAFNQQQMILQQKQQEELQSQVSSGGNTPIREDEELSPPEPKRAAQLEQYTPPAGEVQRQQNIESGGDVDPASPQFDLK